MRSKATIVIVVVLGLLCALLYFLWEPQYNWHEEYYMEETSNMDEEPYGNTFFYRYLKSLREKEDFIHLDSTISINLQSFVEEGVTDHNYVVMGHFPMEADSLVNELIEQFVANGNSFFVFASTSSAWLMEDLHREECVLYWPENQNSYSNPNSFRDSSVVANFTHPELTDPEGFVFDHQVQSHVELGSWTYADEEVFCEYQTAFTVLGHVDHKVNFYRASIEDGYIYVHQTPKLLTNHFLTQEVGQKYAEGVAKHLESGPIIYDMKRWKGSFEFAYDAPARSEGPLKFILSQESLRWAMYTLFAIFGLLILFAFNRKQRVVPVIHPKENSSMEYVETITELYYQQSGQGRIFQHLTDQFKIFVKERYRIPYTEKEDLYSKQLARNSGIPQSQIDKILRNMKKGGLHYAVTSELLIEHYRALTGFYENCK